MWIAAGRTEDVMKGLVESLKKGDGKEGEEEVRIEGVWMQKEVSKILIHRSFSSDLALLSFHRWAPNAHHTNSIHRSLPKKSTSFDPSGNRSQISKSQSVSSIRGQWFIREICQ